jgi:leucyl-tRNA synthetase
MKQWFFKITDYADRLLDGLDKLDWPNKTKVMQQNWIGKSTGERIFFDALEVFTTRPDTILGVTFMAIAPEHENVDKYITLENRAICDEYIAKTRTKSDVERQRDVASSNGCTNKTGVFTGSYVTNPVTKEMVPVWLADYVLASYGTGAVMGVPGYDERDEEFAKAFNLKITKPEFYKKQVGEKTTTYRLRDWGIGRQRYWGCPIPIVYCEDCGTVAVPENELPVKLPYLNDFKPKGQAPLANDPEFVNCKCPTCGKNAKRECDTMDTFVCSSWYQLRYPYAKRNDIAFEKNVMRVDKYVGGAEHSCMHLLYARFFTMVLYDQGLVNFEEPFPSLVHQGMILAKDGSKMSKSKGNTITPDEYVNKYGSDILRLFMLFGFNYTEGGPWNDNTVAAIIRFVERVEKIVHKVTCIPCCKIGTDPEEVLFVQANTVRAVRDDLEVFSFNTAVARCMEFLNAIESISQKNFGKCLGNLPLYSTNRSPSLTDVFLCATPWKSPSKSTAKS